jgi:hypothetical protein
MLFGNINSFFCLNIIVYKLLFILLMNREELMTLWVTMLRLNIYTPDLVAMHGPFTQLPTSDRSKRFYDAFFPAITSQKPVDFNDYIKHVLNEPSLGLLDSSENHKVATHICFDQLMVGGNVRRFFQRLEWHNYGHEVIIKHLLYLLNFIPFSDFFLRLTDSDTQPSSAQ